MEGRRGISSDKEGVEMALQSKAINRGNWALPRGLLWPLTWLKERTRQAVGRRLNREVDGYELKVPYSMAQVYEQVRKGNVVLVEGRLRISRLIKCATKSQADLGKQYDDRNLVHLALMLRSRGSTCGRSSRSRSSTGFSEARRRAPRRIGRDGGCPAREAPRSPCGRARPPRGPEVEPAIGRRGYRGRRCVSGREVERQERWPRAVELGRSTTRRSSRHRVRDRRRAGDHEQRDDDRRNGALRPREHRLTTGTGPINAPGAAA